ncbi:unnamed protein product [Paramecium octaurelia]|uniref:Uncharacterized protein n=1 Tax=Paramecium octaurelia TaxID=43137 RepID=A0A8S1UZK2_PAROT|nr:unnamed protein product [Paramecium octaurelia]
MIKTEIKLLFLVLQLVNAFRSQYGSPDDASFDQDGFQFDCKGGHYHAPGMHPHPCVYFHSDCQYVTETKMIISNGNEMLCHPRVKQYIMWPFQYYEKVLFCQHQAGIYEYSENTDLVLSCQFVLQDCIIAQKSGDIIKCQFCYQYRKGQYCQDLINCGNNCASCTSNYCQTCKEGYSPQSDTDLYCSLACQTGHLTCSLTNNVYAFEGCKKGYEMVGNQCVACPNRCTVCTMGICSECEFHYFLKDNQCFGDKPQPQPQNPNPRKQKVQLMTLQILRYLCRICQQQIKVVVIRYIQMKNAARDYLSYYLTRQNRQKKLYPLLTSYQT